MAIGNTGNKASMRSSTPPWPGSRRLESLAPAARLTSDSNRSPTTLKAASTQRQRQQAGPAEALDELRVEARRIDRPATVDQEHPQRGQHQHAGHAAGHAFPTLARADRRRQLAATEGAAGGIGADVGGPDQAQRRQAESSRRPRAPWPVPARLPTRPANRAPGAATAGQRGHAPGPPRSANAPITSQALAAPHHTPTGTRSTLPVWTAHRPASANNTPGPTAATGATPFSRDHSQPPAAISSSVSNAKGHGVATHSEGSSSASSTTAVITRCSSIGRRSVKR